MLRVALHWVVRRHHLAMGNDLGRPAMLAKMIFLCAYGPFGGVCAMDVWWSELDASLFCGNKRFDVFGCFVVKFV
jgi:hypothetical protein